MKKSYKYHYIIGVGIKSSLFSVDEGERFIRYFYKYTKKDEDKVNRAIEMAKDESFNQKLIESRFF